MTFPVSDTNDEQVVNIALSTLWNRTGKNAHFCDTVNLS